MSRREEAGVGGEETSGGFKVGFELPGVGSLEGVGGGSGDRRATPFPPR